MADASIRVLPALDDAPVDQIVDVYRDAFGAPGYDETPEDVERFRTGLPRHAARDGFRLALAPADGGLVGFAYGYTGQPGQWWTDRLLDRLPRDLTDVWVGGHFEFVELAVRPAAQRGGIGRALHDALLDGLPHRRALLGTWPDDRPARQLYLRAGWRVLAPIDDDRTLMGLELGNPRREG